MEPDTGFNSPVFENHLKEPCPEEFISAVQKAVEGSAYAGILMGYRLLGIKAGLLKVEYEGESESSVKTACQSAAVQAFRNALSKSANRLLEPIFDVDISVPEEFLGDIMSDLNARQAKVEEVRPENHLQAVKARVPLRRIFGYATRLRSISQGRASFSMRMREYALVPDKVSQQILSGAV